MTSILDNPNTLLSQSGVVDPRTGYRYYGDPWENPPAYMRPAIQQWQNTIRANPQITVGENARTAQQIAMNASVQNAIPVAGSQRTAQRRTQRRTQQPAATAQPSAQAQQILAGMDQANAQPMPQVSQPATTPAYATPHSTPTIFDTFRKWWESLTPGQTSENVTVPTNAPPPSNQPLGQDMAGALQNYINTFREQNGRYPNATELQQAASVFQTRVPSTPSTAVPATPSAQGQSPIPRFVLPPPELTIPGQ